MLHPRPYHGTIPPTYHTTCRVFPIYHATNIPYHIPCFFHTVYQTVPSYHTTNIPYHIPCFFHIIYQTEVPSYHIPTYIWYRIKYTRRVSFFSRAIFLGPWGVTPASLYQTKKRHATPYSRICTLRVCESYMATRGALESSFREHSYLHTRWV